MTRPYPEYRDSGDEWLGALPSHWKVRRLKHIADAFPSNVDKKSHEGELPVRLCNYTDVYYNDVIAEVDGLMAATASAEQVEKFSLRAGDVIITKDSETAGDIAVSAYVPEDLPGVVCGYHLSMIRPKEDTSGAFLKRFFDSHYAKSSVAVLANGLTRVGLGQYAVDNLLVPAPPLEEQTAIAAFLDREAGKIDALVDEQRRLITLLKEKRQAFISHAVTKGLDRAFTMKDSGVEWLGDVPEHWPIRRFSAICAVAEGQVDPREEPYRSMVLIAPNHIESGTGHLLGLETAADQGAESGKYQVTAGDVIYSKIRPALAKVALAPCNGLCSADMYPLHARASTHAAYLKWLMLSPGFTAWAVLASDRVAMPKINREKLNSLLVPVPPLTEQVAIAASIEDSCAAIDRLIEQSIAGITLLQERRAALISTAITGQIDVSQRRQLPAPVDRVIARRLVGATILEFVAGTLASGRMTSAKRMYLAEAHAGVWELRGQPQRMAAGPYDGILMHEVEADLERVGHIQTRQPSGRSSQVHYCLTGTRGALRAELDAMLGDRRAVFDKMLADLGTLESRGVEAVATVYAVWNDMLIDGQTPTDDEVINGVLNDWHAEKRDKFTRPDLVNYLGWMRRHDLAPSGRGPRTKSGPLL